MRLGCWWPGRVWRRGCEAHGRAVWWLGGTVGQAGRDPGKIMRGSGGREASGSCPSSAGDGVGGRQDFGAGLGWAGSRPLGADPAQHLPQDPGSSHLAPHITNSSCSLPSAMAVESFTATAPFVQIGRFFLSAGESQAVRLATMAPGACTSTRSPPRSQGPALSRWVLKGVSRCPGWGSANTSPASSFWTGARG